MKKAALIVPLALLAVALYLIAVGLGGGESVQVLTGHQLPAKIALMLGSVGLFGGIAIGIEMLMRARR